MTIQIKYQDHHGNWHHYQSKQNQVDAYRVGQCRTGSTGKRHHLVDGDGEARESDKKYYNRSSTLSAIKPGTKFKRTRDLK